MPCLTSFAKAHRTAKSGRRLKASSLVRASRWHWRSFSNILRRTNPMNYPISLINIGDVLTRSKVFGFVDHAGVLVAPNTVLQNTPERGEHAVTVEEFSAGQAIRVSRVGADPAIIGARSQRILTNPRRYHPFFRNCQHTVYETVTGIAKSPYVVIVFVLVCLAILFLWSRHR